MFIKDAYRPRASVIAKFSKEWCISLTTGGGYLKLHKSMTKGGVAPSTREAYSSKPGLLKIQNLENNYGTTKSQLLRKANGAQSSIDKRHILPKEINT